MWGFNLNEKLLHLSRRKIRIIQVLIIIGILITSLIWTFGWVDEGKLTMQFIMHDNEMELNGSIDITIIIKNEDWHPIRVVPPNWPVPVRFQIKDSNGSWLNTSGSYSIGLDEKGDFPILIPGDKLKYHFKLNKDTHWIFERKTEYRIKAIYKVDIDELWDNSCWEGQLESATKTFTVL